MYFVSGHFNQKHFMIFSIIDKNNEHKRAENLTQIMYKMCQQNATQIYKEIQKIFKYKNQQNIFIYRNWK